MIRRLLTLTRHATAAARPCTACLDQSIREELSSMVHAADMEEIAKTDPDKAR